ncbi:hypothetical protein [Pseudoduganella chitinolytica]|uniref:Uncharacterized protein n=1 Tax=Pseudoduganella chitinolytica TaxID=34070 RepID=A0ABY8B858_9BURK|nr:hypothetical protein [Pseudoduganella chitinolytica]WEF31990.1 hypothetical protein PX653_21550 [Pseudoduganella chitinolytica]
MPRAFDFGDAEPLPGGPPKALSFDDIPPVPEHPGTPLPVAKALFDSEDHPAVRDAMAVAAADYPVLFEHSAQRLAALFRRLLPVRLALVTDWAECPLAEQATLLQPITEMVLQFTRMAVPALLDAALESTRATPGLLDRLFRRPQSPAEYEPALTSARTQLLQLMADSEVAMRHLEASAQNLTLHGAVLAVVTHLARGTPDATLLDALAQRRTLIQQAVRQAELSILQMGQVRQQAVDLIGQISSFLTVTLPALGMAQAQGGA